MPGTDSVNDESKTLPEEDAGVSRIQVARGHDRRKVDGRQPLVDLLLEVSRRMAAFDSLDDVLSALVEMTTNEVGAERGTLFLNDSATNELYSRVAQGTLRREIRLPNTTGIAGFVFTNGQPVNIADPYEDPRFNRSIDEQTGFFTRNILCVPIRTVKGDLREENGSRGRCAGDEGLLHIPGRADMIQVPMGVQQVAHLNWRA